MIQGLQRAVNDLRFAHALFASPFALLAAAMAQRDPEPWAAYAWTGLVCCGFVVVVFALCWSGRAGLRFSVAVRLVSVVLPVVAWIAVRRSTTWLSIVICAAIALWILGLDLLYTGQEKAEHGPGAVAGRFGRPFALRAALVLHTAFLAALLTLAFLAELSGGFSFGCGLVAAFLVVQHRIVRKRGSCRIWPVFFLANGCASLLLCLGAIWDLARVA